MWGSRTRAACTQSWGTQEFSGRAAAPLAQLKRDGLADAAAAQCMGQCQCLRATKRPVRLDGPANRGSECRRSPSAGDEDEGHVGTDGRGRAGGHGGGAELGGHSSESRAGECLRGRRRKHGKRRALQSLGHDGEKLEQECPSPRRRGWSFCLICFFPGTQRSKLMRRV